MKTFPETVVGAEETPVPESATVCGDPPALSATLIFALRDPVVDGVNVTEIVHDASAKRDDEQVFVWEKSAAFVPVIEMPILVMVALPEFVSVTVTGELVMETTVLGKATLVGEKDATGAPGER
jgi:hypothetical protein